MPLPQRQANNLIYFSLAHILAPKVSVLYHGLGVEPCSLHLPMTFQVNPQPLSLERTHSLTLDLGDSPGCMELPPPGTMESMYRPSPLPHHEEQLQRLAAHLRHGEKAMEDS